MAIITISRGTQSGGEALALALAEKLGLPAFSREILQEAAARFGLEAALLQEQLEKTRGLIPGPSPERHLYLAVIQLALAEKAAQGPFVYYGHAGHLLLKEVPQVLKVRVIAPLERRAKRLAETGQLSVEEAKKRIEKMDEGRVKWTRFLYNVDWRDPALYDLVINLDAINLESATEIILCALQQAEFRETPAFREALENFVLASRVKAALARQDRTKGLELEVEVRQGVATITGKFETSGIFPRGNQRIKEDLASVARQVPGIQRVLIGMQELPVAVE